MSVSKHHIVPIETNIKVFVCLLILTVLTVLAAQTDFGQWSIAIAMGIATVKAIVVMLWFMHLKYDNCINKVIVGGAIFFVIVFYVLTAFDIFFR